MDLVVVGLSCEGDPQQVYIYAAGCPAALLSAELWPHDSAMLMLWVLDPKERAHTHSLTSKTPRASCSPGPSSCLVALAVLQYVAMEPSHSRGLTCAVCDSGCSSS